MGYSKFQETRIQNGLCKDCGSERGNLGTKVNCRACADKRARASTSRKLLERASYSEEQCSNCGDVLSTFTHRTCERCRQWRNHYHKQNSGKARLRKLSTQTCLECSSPAYAPAKRCPKHIIGNSIRKYNIPLEQWDLYWQKLQEQKFECYYTGILLVPEKNLSLDHLLPRSKGGSNEIDNCVWCDRNINAFKNDLTDEEFIRRCKIIAQRF
jgi:hypothetical protein